MLLYVQDRAISTVILFFQQDVSSVHASRKWMDFKSILTLEGFDGYQKSLYEHNLAYMGQKKAEHLEEPMSWHFGKCALGGGRKEVRLCECRLQLL